MISLPRPLLAVASALVGLALLSGCTGAATGSAGDDTATPALASVTPVEHPRNWEGPTSVRAASSPVQPIAEPPQVLPAAVTDAQSTAVTVTDTSRVLALDIYGSLSRIVFELGFGDQVVGRDVSSGFAEIADRPLVTRNGHDLNAEAILALAPTVIVTDTSLGPWDTVLQLRDAGVPVVVVDSHRSLAGVGQLISQVAAGLGVPERGDRLAARTGTGIDEAVAAISAIAPADPAEKLRIVFLYVRGQAGVYYLFGQGSGADDLVTALGGVDVSAEIGWNGMRPLTDEGLVAAAPDLVLMMTGGLESVDGVDGLLEAVPALQQTPAGQHRRIVDMPDSQILSFGPDSARVLEALAVGIYAPDAAE